MASVVLNFPNSGFFVVLLSGEGWGELLTSLKDLLTLALTWAKTNTTPWGQMGEDGLQSALGSPTGAQVWLWDPGTVMIWPEGCGEGNR